MNKQEITYESSGVNIAEGARAVEKIRECVKSTYRAEVIGDLGGFGGLFSVAALKNMDDPILVSGTDGVGTKLKLAQMLDKHDSVGIDLVAMCANDVLACGAEPLFFLDYIALGKLDSARVEKIVSGIADGCKQAGCALIGGEMAEHPGTMPQNDYDLSGFCVGVVDRQKMIGPDLVKEGDIILGLGSSGVHSNGFSLVRRAVIEQMSLEQLQKAQESLSGKSIADALLEPTRIYVKPILSALHAGLDVHACAHITGGGITENLNRALPKHLDAQVKLGSWENVPIIDYVVEKANLSEAEALKTFNMGLGMCVVCNPNCAKELGEHLTKCGEKVFEIGTIVKGGGGVVYEK